MSAVGGTQALEQLQAPVHGRAVGLVPVDSPDVLRVDVAEVVGGAVELLSVTRRLREVRVSLELPEDPVPANVSHRRLQQVLLLLLAHAADASNGQGVRVMVDSADDFGDLPPRFQVQVAGASLSSRELQAVFLSPMLVGPAAPQAGPGPGADGVHGWHLGGGQQRGRRHHRDGGVARTGDVQLVVRAGRHARR
uniref:Adventurous gliding motility protein Z n=1 Tax=Myxococcus xanthus TaxID=34 RepID=Q846U0_MYXXA|nr:adventurous gliding motility protein Z [Myxococcus xanthus]